MPSTSVPAPNRDHEEFPEIQADLGYDPARFLDRDLFGAPGEDTPLRTALSLIKGLDDLAELQGWLDVEVGLERGPRKPVIAALNERKADLEDHGEAPESIPLQAGADGPDRFHRHGRDRPPADTYIVRHEYDPQAGERVQTDRVPYEDARSGTAGAKLANRRRSDQESSGGEA